MSSERTKLQGWVKSIGDRPDWTVWKVEDRYRPGLPDSIMKHRPSGRVSWLELKWRSERHVQKRTGDFRTGLTADQRRHLVDWGDGAYLAAAVEPHDLFVLIPAAYVPKVEELVTPEFCRGAHGIYSCRLRRSDVVDLLVETLS